MACEYCESVKRFSETGKLGGAGGRGAGPAVAKGAKPVVFELLVEGCSLLEVRSRPPMPRRRRSRLLRGRPRRRGPVPMRAGEPVPGAVPVGEPSAPGLALRLRCTGTIGTLRVARQVMTHEGIVGTHTTSNHIIETEQVNTHAHTHMHRVHTGTHAHTRTHTTHTCTQAHTHARACSNTRTRTHARTRCRAA